MGGALQTGANFNQSQSQVRKTIIKKEIKQIQERAPKYDTKVEDKQLAKDINMDTMESRILEHLLHFLSLTEEDNPTKVADKFNKQRLDVQGSKPLKQKLQEAQKALNN